MVAINYQAFCRLSMKRAGLFEKLFERRGGRAVPAVFEADGSASHPCLVWFYRALGCKMVA
jgi:hypothetical protein